MYIYAARAFPFLPRKRSFHRSLAVISLRIPWVAALQEPVKVITRLRLVAALYDPAPPRKAGTHGRPLLKGARQPTLAQRLGDPKTT
jgi:hypothetical protein